jgi:hypothetical protein
LKTSSPQATGDADCTSAFPLDDISRCLAGSRTAHARLWAPPTISMRCVAPFAPGELADHASALFSS